MGAGRRSPTEDGVGGHAGPVARAEAPSHHWQETVQPVHNFQKRYDWGKGWEAVYAELSFHVMLLSFIEDFDI